MKGRTNSDTTNYNNISNNIMGLPWCLSSVQSRVRHSCIFKKNLHTKQETRVRSLGLEDFLAKEMATHSSILAWRIPWTEKSGGLQSMGLQKSQT